MYKLLISGSFIHAPPVIRTNDTIWKWHHPLTLPINSTLTIVMSALWVSLFVVILFTEMGLCLCKMNMHTDFLYFSCVRKEKSVKATNHKEQMFFILLKVFFLTEADEPSGAQVFLDIWEWSAKSSPCIQEAVRHSDENNYASFRLPLSSSLYGGIISNYTRTGSGTGSRV